ncbi:MAG: hypothetical protein WDN03_06210 [Rhizomicrobium sp.]
MHDERGSEPKRVGEIVRDLRAYADSGTHLSFGEKLRAIAAELELRIHAAEASAGD